MKSLHWLYADLVSGKEDGSIQVWGTGADGGQMVERSLLGNTEEVWSLVEWQPEDKVASGSSDGRVWGVGMGTRDATLVQPLGTVLPHTT